MQRTWTWKRNVVFGVIAFLFAFTVSFSGNLLATSIIRGLWSFLLFFVASFLFRSIWRRVNETSANGCKDEEKNTSIEYEQDEGTLTREAQQKVHDKDIETIANITKTLMKD